jgi:hypothetical protein
MTVRTRRATVCLGTLAILAGLALAGCGGDNESGGIPPANQADGDPAPAGGALDPARGEDGTAEEPAAPGGNGQGAPAPVTSRSLIYSGSITVVVDDVVAAANQAAGIATGVRGVVGGDQRSIDGDRSSATLVLRIPAESFSSTLDTLAQLGDEESRSVQTEDVTEAVVDLDARLATQRASVTRVRRLLERANQLGEIVSIEAELAKREAELASLEQRRTRLADLVALSTVTLNLRGRTAPAAKPAEPESGFLAGLSEGWAAFSESVKVALTVAGWLLPWVALIGVPVWLAVRLLRRRRRPVAAPAVAPAPTAER